MAAAALLRSGSVARKLARAPPTPHPRPLLASGLHGGARSSGPSAAAGLTKVARAPPQPLHHRLLLGRGLHSRAATCTAPAPPTTARTRIGGVRLSVIAMYSYFWLLYAAEEARERLLAVKTLQAHLIRDFLADEGVPAASVFMAEIMQKQECHGEEFVKLCYEILEEAPDTEELGVDLKGFRADIARILEL